jgi:predicted nucleic acid-binding protein
VTPDDVLILYASVAAAIFFTEPGRSEKARDVAGGRIDLIAPDFLFIEMASIASKKVRRGEVPIAFAERALASLPTLLSEVISSSPLIGRAFALSAAHGVSVYDGLYLALAEERGCPVLTADIKLVERGRAAGLGVLVRAL